MRDETFEIFRENFPIRIREKMNDLLDSSGIDITIYLQYCEYFVMREVFLLHVGTLSEGIRGMMEDLQEIIRKLVKPIEHLYGNIPKEEMNILREEMILHLVRMSRNNDIWKEMIFS